MKTSLWIIGYTLSALLAIVVAGYIGIIRSAALIMAPAPEALAAAVVPQPAPGYDADKPTVAVLLGNTRTEATDFLAPYAMFAESGAYNVYAVAESRAVRTLAGGVDVVPQFSFRELAARLHHSPDIIVVPAMTAIFGRLRMCRCSIGSGRMVMTRHSSSRGVRVPRSWPRAG